MSVVQLVCVDPADRLDVHRDGRNPEEAERQYHGEGYCEEDRWSDNEHS